MVDVGGRIKTLRRSQKLTQGEFAERLGVSKSAISAYENGSRQPSYDILIKIAGVFKVSTDYLLGREDEKVRCVNVSGLTDRQVEFIQNAINTYRAVNVLREKATPEIRGLLDEIVDAGS